MLGMTLAESFERLSGDELDIWIAEHSIEPFGDDWLQAATTASAAANAFGGKTNPEMYMPRLPEKQSPEEILAVGRAASRAHNASRQ